MKLELKLTQEEVDEIIMNHVNNKLKLTFKDSYIDWYQHVEAEYFLAINIGFEQKEGEASDD